jgi:hypothetical protein
MEKITPDMTVDEVLAANPEIESFLEDNPEISIGDVLQLWPLLEQLLAIIAAGAPYQGTVPLVKLRLHGHHLSLGPCPAKVTD